MEDTDGISRDRTLPAFQRETLRDWWAGRGSRVANAESECRVVLFPDTFTNYANPEIGQAAIRVLEAAGIHVELANRTDSGRPAHSKGFLDRSRGTARATVEALTPLVEDGWEVVLLEPSDAVMFQSDYLDLLGEDARPLADNTYGVCEYLDSHHLDDAISWREVDESLVYHGHCHRKATKRDHHAVGVLRRSGYDVTPLDSGCCGMAGTFGYEAEHDSMSRAIGSILADQIAGESGTVVAPGESCRSQLESLPAQTGAIHPVMKLEERLPD